MSGLHQPVAVLRIIVQVLPFHDSAMDKDDEGPVPYTYRPMAMQALGEAQDTVPRELGSAPPEFRVGLMAQLAPFRDSARVT